MADRARRRRLPLAELRNTENTPPTQQRFSKRVRTSAGQSPVALPHNVSLEPNGSLTTRSQANSPEHKRHSKLINEDGYESKRNSAISTTSTNASGRKRKAYIGHWQLGKTIGKGGCSRVRAVRHRITNQYGAVKIIARSTAESTRAQSLANLIESTKGSSMVSPSGYRPIPYGLEREIALMKLLEHENIVRLYDVWENRNELYLIMEHVDGGELFHYVESRRGLSEEETVIIFRQIVAALLYCHRLHICHRDLKPENILLNQENLQVKLIDFGMAALQPQGKLLSTPCGSPHYAAPEVVSARPYDGKSADAWSCGVILYVMLTGTTPFNYSQNGDIRTLFADITRARYVMPQELSMEAKDLIKKIFVTDSKSRINMDGIWDHPLLHKYDTVLGFDGPHGTKEAAIGPIPQLEDWSVKRVQDIDREILRNMRTLWHSEPESSLMQKLLNKSVNQEKIFYAALIKHRDENLENYISEYDNMTYSASDYHHHAQPVRAPVVPPMPLDKQQRSQSQYSIMNNEHLRPSNPEPAPSVSSYDPYRASRDPIVDRNEYIHVVVHRDSSARTSRTSARTSVRHNQPLRVGMLKHNGRSTYNQSSSSLTRSARSRSSLNRSSVSRQSLSTLNWPSSPPVIATIRPSETHKRGVSFNHIRRTSTLSALGSPPAAKPAPVTPARKPLPGKSKLNAKVEESPDTSDGSPIEEIEQPIRTRKTAAAAGTVSSQQIKTSVSHTPGRQLRHDIRKHSMELEKACEEAFFRSSVGSNLTQSPFSDASTADTPPSSVSARALFAADAKPADKPPRRPLPDIPVDTPNTYLARTLKELRSKLNAYKSQSGTAGADFDEIYKFIDKCVPAQQNAEKRLVSAPEQQAPDHLGRRLPIISEESNSDVNSKKHRSVTAPVSKAGEPTHDQTVRVVSPTSPVAIAPLDIRRRLRELESAGNAAVATAAPHGYLRRQRSHDAADVLEAINEDEVLPPSGPVLKKKRSLWFGFGKKGAETSNSASQPTDKTKHRSSHTMLSSEEGEQTEAQDLTVSTVSTEFPQRDKQATKAKTRLANWLRKTSGRDRDDIGASTMETTFADHSLESLFSDSSPTPSINQPIASAGRGRSWFTRFLHIKPAVKILCFNIARPRVRQELVILLKEWQRHGIRDLQYSRETKTITARVDRQNSLDIKPVSFRIEMFVVLENGCRSGLSIARFTQTKGAASGFKRVLEVVDGVMRDRGWLVEDEEKWKALCSIIEDE